MIIEKFLDQAERESAETGEPKRRASDRINATLFPRELVSHRALPFGIAVWCAALAGCCVMVLGPGAIARITVLTGASTNGPSSQSLYASIAAACAALLGFVGANLIQRRIARASFDPAFASRAARTVHAIDPKTDLGVESLDAPLEETPCILDSIPEDQEPEPGLQTHDAPREMDLEEFGKLPGRDAVWVHDPAQNPEAPVEADETEPKAEEPVEPTDTELPATEPVESAPITGPMTAIEKLRAVPAKDLNLVQMVERFAAALRDHQDKVEALSPDEPQPAETAAREAALVDALKALSAYSHRGFQDPNVGQRGLQAVRLVNETEEELREALAKLKILRGAA